jgi:hypothetical protein
MQHDPARPHPPALVSGVGYQRFIDGFTVCAHCGGTVDLAYSFAKTGDEVFHTGCYAAHFAGPDHG